MRRAFKWRAARDPVWFVDTFGWTYSPKDFPKQPWRPFILWDYQEKALIKMLSAIGEHDILIEKSRDMGASWLCLLAHTYHWQFVPDCSFLWVSRDESLVDKAGNPKALFWKFDKFLERQPSWIRPAGYNKKVHRKKLIAINPEHRGTISGSTTTSDTARGDRLTGILQDEFAAVENGNAMLRAARDATNSRFINSTPQGTGNAYYQLRKKFATESPEWLLRFHWTQHPLKSRGLYYDSKKKPRSPWYDDQCKRAANQQEIAQEIDIDYAGSATQFFDVEKLDELVSKYAKHPYQQGVLTFNDSYEPNWTRNAEGKWQLWTHVDNRFNRPLPGRYVVSCDIAAGKGGRFSSFSALSVVNIDTGEKAAQYLDAHINPTEFAKLAIACCKWFTTTGGKDAYLIWEDNGMGAIFHTQVLETSFRYFYYRDKEPGAPVTSPNYKKPGWWSTPAEKKAMLGAYAEALLTGKFLNRSESAIRECGEFIMLPNGDIVHSGSTRDSEDPSSMGANHGDIVIADALACLAMSEFNVQRVDSEKTGWPTEYPPGSAGERIQLEMDKLTALQDDFVGVL